jgi:prepilin-type N-terminal cleavage/methylation domain-containing protein
MGRSAFSLFELIVVLVILALLGCIAVPRFSHAAARQRASAAAKRVAADLRMARHRAVHGSEGTKVAFSREGYAISGVRGLDRSTGTYTVDLGADPYGARIVAVDFGGDAEITFDVYGTPDSEGQVVLAVGKWHKTVTLAAETGKTKVD